MAYRVSTVTDDSLRDIVADDGWHAGHETVFQPVTMEQQGREREEEDEHLEQDHGKVRDHGLFIIDKEVVCLGKHGGEGGLAERYAIGKGLVAGSLIQVLMTVKIPDRVAAFAEKIMRVIYAPPRNSDENNPGDDRCGVMLPDPSLRGGGGGA